VLQNDPLRLPPFNFDADPDRAFHCDADPETAFQFDADPAFHFDADPETAFRFDADPCGSRSRSATLLYAFLSQCQCLCPYISLFHVYPETQ